MSNRRQCKFTANSFCFICGQYMPSKNRDKCSQIAEVSKLENAYELYFECRVVDQDKPWAPHVTCENCRKNLCGWLA